jgi:hypothetical protein
MIAAVLMHVMNFVSHVAANSGRQYTYSVDTAGKFLSTRESLSAERDHITQLTICGIDKSLYWDPTSVILAVSVATAVLCFLLLAINVDRMKLSRNALDLVVIRFKKELSSTIAQVTAGHEREIVGRKEREKLWRMLETINLCRPMHRDHALATAIADYEIEPASVQALLAPANSGKNDTWATNNGSSNSPTHAAAMAAASGLNTKSDDDMRPPQVRAASALAIYQQLCGSVQINGPTPDALAREVKLEHLLKHPVRPDYHNTSQYIYVELEF